jgi:type I restriction enzyme S subunit
MLPLPPFEEQKAIVQKVNSLMGLCDRLEQEVQQIQEHIEMLMQSCLREVFEPNNIV